MLARGRRLSTCRLTGWSWRRATPETHGVGSAVGGRACADDRYEVVLVPVRSEELASTLPVLTAMNDGWTCCSSAIRPGTRQSSSRPSASVHCSASPRPVVFGTARHQVRTDQPAEDDARRTERHDHTSGTASPACCAMPVSHRSVPYRRLAVRARRVHRAYRVRLYRAVSMRPRWPPIPHAAVDGARDPAGFHGVATGDAEIPTTCGFSSSPPDWFVIGYWRRVFTSPRVSCRSARTPAPHPMRCALWLSCKKRRAAPDVARPTSTGCWPTQSEPPRFPVSRTAREE